MARTYYGTVYKTDFDGVLFEDLNEATAYDISAACALIFNTAAGGPEGIEQAIKNGDPDDPFWQAINWLNNNAHRITKPKTTNAILGASLEVG